MGHGETNGLGVTVTNTYTDSHIDKTAVKPGEAANKTAQNKTDKYARLYSQHPYLLVCH